MRRLGAAVFVGVSCVSLAACGDPAVSLELVNACGYAIEADGRTADLGPPPAESYPPTKIPDGEAVRVGTLGFDVNIWGRRDESDEWSLMIPWEQSAELPGIGGATPPAVVVEGDLCP